MKIIKITKEYRWYSKYIKGIEIPKCKKFIVTIDSKSKFKGDKNGLPK